MMGVEGEAVQTQTRLLHPTVKLSQVFGTQTR